MIRETMDMVEEIGEEHGIDVKKVGSKTIAKRGMILGAIRAVGGKGAAAAAEKAASRAAAEVVGKEATKKLSKAAAMSAARGATKAGAVKAGAKVGGKAIGKVIPGLNIAMAAYDGAPVLYRGAKETASTAYEGAKTAGKALRAGQLREAAKVATRTGAGFAADMTITTGKTAVAALTAKELAELIPSRQKMAERKKAKQNPELQGTPYLLSLMMSLRDAYQYAHWNSGRYADHLLFERLYKSLDEDIDALAELTVYRDVRPLRRVEVSISQIPKAEEAIIRIATEMVENERPSKGMENYLLNLVEHRERAIYLLRMASGQ